MAQLKKIDILGYIKLLRILYGEKAYDLEQEDLDKLVTYWYNQLKDYPKEIVDRALQSHTNTCEFAPTIAHILKKIKGMEESLGKDENGLWEELEGVLYEVYSNSYKYKFASGSLYMERNKEIYENLSPEIKAYVRNCGQLVALANADERTLSIEKGRFLNNLPKIKERVKYQEMLPNEYKQLVNGIAEKMKLENKLGEK